MVTLLTRPGVRADLEPAARGRPLNALPRIARSDQLTESFTVPDRPRTSKETARVVYFVASHVCPEQIARLARACRTGGDRSRVLIHHDYKCSDLPPESVEPIPNLDLMRDSAPVEWGGFTQCVMILRSMQWLLDNRDFDWVVYLSGQDYPCMPLAQIERELTDADCDGFLDANPVENRWWVIGGQRYLYQYFTLPKFRGWGRVQEMLHRRNERILAQGGVPRFVIPQEKDRGFRVGYRPVFTPWRNGFKCYAGSSWWTLNRRSIEYMVRFARQNHRLAHFYRRVQFAPNESYFLTILLNNPELKLEVRRSKRFIRWSHPETGHPDVLRADDFNEIVNSGCHFARKIDQRKDPRLLDLLDEHIGIPRR